VKNSQLEEELWPALFARRHVKSENLDPQQLALLWQGEMSDEFAEATIISTAAIALKLIGRAESQQQAYDMAKQFWAERSKKNLFNK
jgi:anthranilate phosphoribosyltransferase